MGDVIRRQDPKKIERMYDAVAAQYAEAFTGEHEKKPMDQEMLRRFSRAIGESGPVLDLGCGPGQTARYLKDLGVDISGLDLSEKLLEQARSIHPGITFRKGDILDLDLDDDSIAGVVSFYTICHFTTEQVKKTLDEVFRILRPGGLFLFTYHVGDQTIHVKEFLGKEIDIDFMLFPTDLIRGYLDDSGFNKIEIIEREPYPGVEYESRRAYGFAAKP
jgi:SAM-dependent methyltransferase